MWAIVVLVSLAVLITLLLCVPLDLVLRMDTARRPKFSMRLAWLFGLVKTGIRKKKPEEKKTTAEHKRKLGDWWRDTRTIFEVLRTKGMLRQITRLLKGIFRRLKIRELIADLKIGLDNPADTGLLFAFTAPVNLLVRSFSPHQIRVEPSFTGEAAFQGYFYGAVRLRPIQLMAPLAGFAFSLPAIRAIKTLVLSRWREK